MIFVIFLLRVVEFTKRTLSYTEPWAEPVEAI